MKKLRNNFCLCLFFLLIVINTRAMADELVKIQQQTLAQIKNQLQEAHWHSFSDNNDWAYTVETRLDNGNTGNNIQQTKQRFDPRLPLSKQWQLLESDFNQPTPVRLAEYNRTRQQIIEDGLKESASQSHHLDDKEHDTLVDITTLSLIEDNPQYYEYTFTPKLPMFEQKINQQFKGTLLFDVQKQQVTQLRFEAQKKFSPRTGLTFKNYQLVLNMEVRGGQLHLISSSSRKTGKALFVTSFDEKSSRHFTQFSSLKS